MPLYRLALVLLALAACTRKPSETPAVIHRPRASLPFVDLGWVRMHDHFVATVGPSAGQGRPLGDLLVLADATFAPKSRFPFHEHAEMEIVSIVLSGTLTHHEPSSSLKLAEGSTQLMSARAGITHAEGNDTEGPVRMLQLWIRPSTSGGEAVHRVFGPFSLGAELTRVTPEDLRQDAVVSMARVKPGEKLRLEAKAGRRLYVLCAGEGTFEGTKLADGDGMQLDSGAGTFAGDATLVVIDTRSRAP